MNKSLMAIIAVVVLGLVVLYASAFTVQETEQVVVVQFGKVVRKIEAPGLHFKLPFIQEAKRFEKRWLEWDGDASQITTADKRYIYIDVFARWRISDPLIFIETLRDEASAQSRLDDIIDNATRNVVANHALIEAIRTTNREFSAPEEEQLLTEQTEDLSNLVDDALAETKKLPKSLEDDKNAAVAEAAPGLPEQAIDVDVDSDTQADTDAEQEPEQAEPTGREEAAQNRKSSMPSPIRDKMQDLLPGGSSGTISVGREKLTEFILEKAQPKAFKLGIELKDMQFKRIDYIESVQAKVFERMISERQRVAEAFRSQGQGLSAQILGQLDRELRKIRSMAYKSAEMIKGEADGKAASIYAEAYNKDPEFYNFLKTLESYAKTVDGDSWLILTTQADFAHHLQNIQGGPN